MSSPASSTRSLFAFIQRHAWLLAAIVGLLALLASQTSSTWHRLELQHRSHTFVASAARVLRVHRPSQSYQCYVTYEYRLGAELYTAIEGAYGRCTWAYNTRPLRVYYDPEHPGDVVVERGLRTVDGYELGAWCAMLCVSLCAVWGLLLVFRAEYIDAGIVGLPANANPKGKVVRRDDFLWFVRGTLIATAGVFLLNFALDTLLEHRTPEASVRHLVATAGVMALAFAVVRARAPKLFLGTELVLCDPGKAERRVRVTDIHNVYRVRRSLHMGRGAMALVEVRAVVKNGTPGGEDVCLLTSYSEARAELFRAWLLARVAELEPAQGVSGWPAPGIRP